MTENLTTDNCVQNESRCVWLNVVQTSCCSLFLAHALSVNWAYAFWNMGRARATCHQCHPEGGGTIRPSRPTVPHLIKWILTSARQNFTLPCCISNMIYWIILTFRALKIFDEFRICWKRSSNVVEFKFELRPTSLITSRPRAATLGWHLGDVLDGVVTGVNCQLCRCCERNGDGISYKSLEKHRLCWNCPRNTQQSFQTIIYTNHI